MKIFKHTMCFLLAISFFQGISVCFAKDITFDVSVDKDKVSLGQPVQLNISFYGTQDVPPLDLPAIDGFKTQYVGPSTSISVVNGRVSMSITHIYLLTPLKEGTFNIPSFSIDYKGDKYTSRPVTIQVVQGPVGPPPGASSPQQEEAMPDLKDRLFVVIELGEAKTYLNELIPLSIKLYINNLPVKDIQYPVLENDAFLMDRLSEPRQYRETISGLLYDVIEFNTTICGTRAGEFELGPANIKCKLLVKTKSGNRPYFPLGDNFFDSDIFNDFMGRYNTYQLDLNSNKIPITILPLPEGDRPSGFNGAVGDYQFDIQADPAEVKVGDPITLKMVFLGSGNFKTLIPPKINIGDNFKVYEPEIKQGPSGKTFEQVIIPKDEKVAEIPAISFSFFDPGTGRYKTITRGPVPIKVNPLPKGQEFRVFESPAAGEAAAKKETLGRDIIYIKDTPGVFKRKGEFLYKNKLFILSQFIPLFCVIAVSLISVRKKRLETDIKYARRLRAPRKARKNLSRIKTILEEKDKTNFFDVVFKTLQEYMGDKFHLSSAGITSKVVEEELRPRNIDEKILNEIKTVFSNCDIARYAPSNITDNQMLETLAMLEEIIASLERIRI